MFSISEQTLRRVTGYANRMGKSRDQIMESAANEYLDKREKD
jgi:predicted transcriptional regulator